MSNQFASKPIVCLMGPTASGKTALATQLVQLFPFEIISVDSAMIYRDMNIGTAKPTKDELIIAPHHLIDILDPPESYSAAQFCDDAKQLIEAIYSRGRVPLLVGGTMMYFHALQQGLSLLPEANEAIRSELLQRLQTEGRGALYQQLTIVDPPSALRIHPHDTQRILRALEVYAVTGQALSSFLLEEKTRLPYTFVNLILFPEQRAWLHARIAKRFEMMLEAGFIAEVEQLLKKWHLEPASPAIRSVGYRQAQEYLAGDYDYSTFCQKGIAATRQLAKRQLTWLRRWQQANFFACESLGPIVAIIKKILDNHHPGDGV